MIHATAVIGEPPEARDTRHSSKGLAPVIAETATVEALVTVDAGVDNSTVVDEHAWLMKGVHVGHDARIGKDCELAPKTVVGGYAVLETGVHCGIGALVLPRKRVGAGARIGAGAVVTKDVPAGETWVGNPARRLVKGKVAGLEAFVPELDDTQPLDPYEVWGEWWDRTRA